MPLCAVGEMKRSRNRRIAGAINGTRTTINTATMRTLLGGNRRANCPSGIRLASCGELRNNACERR